MDKLKCITVSQYLVIIIDNEQNLINVDFDLYLVSIETEFQGL